MDDVVRLLMFLGAVALAGVCWVYVGPQSSNPDQLMSEYLVPQSTVETKKLTQGFADFAQQDANFKKNLPSTETRSPAAQKR
jgi:hypothetical protein